RRQRLSRRPPRSRCDCPGGARAGRLARAQTTLRGAIARTGRLAVRPLRDRRSHRGPVPEPALGKRGRPGRGAGMTHPVLGGLGGWRPGPFASRVGFNGLAQLSPILASVIVTPVLIHRLGSDRFGIWSFVLIVLSTLTSLDGGISASLARFFAIH